MMAFVGSVGGVVEVRERKGIEEDLVFNGWVKRIDGHLLVYTNHHHSPTAS